MIIQENAIISLTSLSNDQDFQDQYKDDPKHFSRNRKLSFVRVVGMLLRMVKTSLQISCNWLGDIMDNEPASKQAFSVARQKISSECFQAFHEDGLRVNYTLTGQNGLWEDFRLISCDGSTLRLPESKELAEVFGRGPSAKGQALAAPTARISEFTDMTSKLVLSGCIAPYHISEAELAKEQLIEVVKKMQKHGQKKLLFVYDRGYPSEEFINLHLDLGVDFLFRVPKNFNTAISEIYASN